MSINSDNEGKRIIEASVEIRATPEAVWKAIATGPGIASWFMKMETEFDERVGGEVRARMGDEMVPIAKLTAWDPPRKFASKGDNAFGPGSPAMAYEWTVEAKDGDTCVVRLVQTLFAEDDAWDTQLGDTEPGWNSFFHILRNYVERHADQPSAVVQAMAPVPGEQDEAFARLTKALGITDVSEGARVDSAVDGAPAFSGEIEAVVIGQTSRAMIRLEEPYPGTAWVGAGPIGGKMTAVVSLYCYGDGAPDTEASDNAKLGAWLQGHGQAVST